ncbi:MAG: ROK family protein [Acidobacteria bacterium]|nr:MAG: ROK family protein [Acidobacteriota bacterium]
MTKEPVYVGIDLGGTTFTIGLVRPDGQLVASANFETAIERGHEDIIDRMAQETVRVWERHGYSRDDILEVGVGSPGPLDLKTGTVITTPNLKWVNVPLRDMMSERLKLPVTIDNDAVSATFGEFWVGAGKPYNDVVGITLGTGVGGGIILGGRILHGAQDIAGHVGHMIIQLDGRQCGCGNLGCLETYASATGIVASTVEALKTGRPSLLHSVTPLTSKRVWEAAVKGDSLALEIFDRTGYYLAAGINSVLNVINPEAVILMGAVANAGDILMNPVKQYLKKMSFPRVYEETRILRGTLGDQAGVIGAAGFAKFR